MSKAKETKKTKDEEIKDGSTEENIAIQAQANEQEPEVKEQADSKLSTPEPKVTTKAGKHSKKGIAEAEEKAVKEARKKGEVTDETVAAKPKPAQKPARSRAERAGKKYRASLELVDKTKEYGLKEAIELAVKTAKTKFDSSVELHVRLGVDPRQADQNIRGSLVLPEGTGKAVRVAVFGEADTVDEAKKAGADIAGGDDFLAQLDKGKIDFDILVATPNVMAKLGKYARVLGPKGLMPNPKSGTVTTNVDKAIAEAKAGKIEYRVDSTGIVHAAIGKVSFGADKIFKNAEALLASLKAAKPSSVKGNYVLTIFATTTMGPSVRVSTSEL